MSTQNGQLPVDPARPSRRTNLFVRCAVLGVVALGILMLLTRWQVLDLLARLGGGHPARDIWLGAAICGVPIVLLLVRRVWFAVAGRGRATGALGWAAALLCLPALYVAAMLFSTQYETDSPGSFEYAIEHRVPDFDVGVYLGVTPAVALGIWNCLYRRVRRR